MLRFLHDLFLSDELVVLLVEPQFDPSELLNTVKKRFSAKRSVQIEIVV